MATSRDPIVQQVHDQVDNYESTVLGLLGFWRALTWRNKQVVAHHVSLGRKMSPQSTAVGESADPLTPDEVLQIAEAIGFVVEAKRSMPSDQQHWRKYLSQIQRYDQPLAGWWTATETITSHNVVLLLWTTYTREFQALIEAAQQQGTTKLTDRVSIVEFSHLQEAQEAMRFRLEWGSISDEGISRPLRSGISVPLEILVAHPDSRTKFYDAPPPTEYLMVILWQEVFNSHLPELEFDSDTQAWPLEVSVPSLAEELQRLHGSTGDDPRERRFPRQSWVHTALEAFCKIGLAQHIEDDRYLVLFKPTLRTTSQRDLISRFSSHRSAKPLDETSLQEQLPLFSTETPRRSS